MNSDTKKVTVVLGIDSAMNGCGVALYFGDEPERNVSAMLPMERGQAEALVPLVKDTVARANIEFSDIDVIVTTRGPGTFTGLRVGLSAARSFALTLDIPLLGVSTLEALVRGYIEKQSSDINGVVAVIVESKRSDFYFQLFDAQCRALSEACAIDADAIVTMLSAHTGVIIGDAQLRFKAECGDSIPDGFLLIEGEGIQPDPLTLAHIGYKAPEHGDYKDTTPLYLRGADVSIPKSAPRKLEQQ